MGRNIRKFARRYRCIVGVTVYNSKPVARMTGVGKRVIGYTSGQIIG